MTQRNWLMHLRPRPGERMPTSLRFAVGDRGGFRRSAFFLLHWFLPQHLFLDLHWNPAGFAFCSASAGGVWLRISSWAGVLPDVGAMDCYCAGGAWRCVWPWWLGRTTADRFGVGNSDRHIRMDRAAARDAQH